jgi:hypothetical protein
MIDACLPAGRRDERLFGEKSAEEGDGVRGFRGVRYKDESYSLFTNHYSLFED